MQIHAQVGAQIVEAVPLPVPRGSRYPEVTTERWDGDGISDEPQRDRTFRLARESWPSSIVSTPSRPNGQHRRAVTPEAAIRMLEQDAGKAFDPAIVKTFAELLPNLAPPVDEPSRGLHLSEIAGIETSMPVAGTIGVWMHVRGDRARQPESFTLYEIDSCHGKEHEPRRHH